MQRRMPYTLAHCGAALERGLAEGTCSLALALAQLRRARATWPCALAARAARLAPLVRAAAAALDAASLGLA